MRRIVTFLVALIVLLALPATARTRKSAGKAPKDPAPVMKTRGEAEAKVPAKGRKSIVANDDDDDTPVGKQPGPVVVGPPAELRATKASGKKIDLRTLPFLPPAKRERPERVPPPFHPVGAGSGLIVSPPPSPSAPIVPQPNAPAPGPLMNFDGLDFNNWGAGHPPDTNGDVGPTYYIQTINTSIGVFRKSDGVRVAAFTFDTFMSQGSFGNLCDTDNFGDPVVLYDTFADRWIISDFAFTLDASQNVVSPPGAFQCFAVSMNGDPVTGGWYFYSINTAGGLGDYPKLGIWPDGLYLSVNMFDYAASGSFQNSRLYALNKAQMYAGSPTVKVVSFNLPADQFTVLPANARLQTGTPPAGSSNYFASVWNFLNSVEIWKFHVDWDHIPLSTVTGPFSSTNAFWWAQFSRGGLETAPTPANANDTLYPRLMMQNQYTNIGGVESLWNSHTVGAGNPTSNTTSSQSAVRFLQVPVTGGTVGATTQSFAYSPDATVYRYMPSVAVNRAGDMAIGYSTSNASNNPALKYAGRLAGDAANSISLTEQTLHQGTGAQSGSCGGTCERWGDYSAMSLDPNGCTFWYTNEYYAVNGLNHQTRIGSFVFPSCTAVGAGGTLQGTITATTGGAPISGATVVLEGRTTTTNASGVYQFTGLPAGTYPTLTASAPGYNTATSTSIAITDGNTTTRNLTLDTASSGSCFIDTTQTDFKSGVPTNIDLDSTPGDAKLTKPDNLDQSNGQVNPTGFSFTATSWVAQTFTAGLSGQLTKADVELFCNACSGANPNLTISIRATTGATPVPTGADLASTTLAGFNDGGAGGLKSVTFGTPATITAGTRYALVVRSVTTRVTGSYVYTCSCASSPYVNFNPYASGQRATSANSGTSWTADTTTGGRDLNFRVYINSGYSPSGELLSSTKDGNPSIGNRPTWTTLSWTSTTPASTIVRFQAAGSNNVNGPFSYVGPDGTAATFFTTSGASISQFNGFRYLKYRANLTTSLGTATPTLSDATVCFSDVACPGSPPAITPSPAQVCANTAGNSASGPAGMTNYTWSITNGTITAGINSQTVTYTAGASGTVILQLIVTDATGCVKSNTANVTINPFPSTPTATNDGPYCTGGTIHLFTPTVAGATYAWTGPNGFSSALQNPTRTGITASDAGTYSVTVTVNGCTSAAGTTSVTINATPATPSASNTGPYCAGQTIQLNTPTVSGATYSWTGPNGFTSSLQNPTRSNATTADAGTYSVTITVNGCTSAAGTTNVVVNATPATPTASNTGPYCTGQTIQLSTPSVAGATYSWTGPNGFTSSLQNPTRSNATTADAGTYSVTITVNGCTSAAGTTSVTVNATPATPTASNTGPYCQGATIQLSTSSVAGAIYSWTGPNGFTSSLQNPTRSNATTADAGTYSVTITVNGCTSAAGTTNVVVNATPATPTASNTGPYCEGATIQLSTPTVSGATYSWTGPNGFTSSLQNPTRANATTADAGTYSVTITVSGCTSAAGTTNVVVNATPATPTATNGGPYCAGATIQLNTPTVSGATYSWTGPNGFTSALQNPTRSNATTADAGTYSVTITVSGCTSAAGTTNVVVNATPATPAASNTGPYCEGAPIQLSTPFVSGATYAWTGPNGFASSLQNPTRANAATADAGTYSVTITVNSCTSAAGTTNVVVNATPATPTASNTGPYCEGATIQLSTPFVSGATYAWTGPNGFTSALQNPTRSNATTADAGTYFVTITVNGCTSAAGTTNVVVNATPATPAASNTGPYCEGATIQLSTPFVSGATYSWTGPNGFTSSLQNPTRSNATTADAGTYSVTITVNGCTSAAGTTNVVVNATPATPTASNGGPYCEGATIQLSTPFVSGATYSWTGPNGFTSSLQNPTRANATTADAGTYSVTITVNGCTSAAGTTNVVVNATPATPTASNTGPYCEGATIQLSTPFVSGATYAWTGPNGFTSALQNPTRSNATTADAGTYSVTITVNGCTSAAGTTNVVVNAAPATPTASNTGPYCEGATIQLSTPFVSGATYSWTGPNGFTSALQNPTRANATTADAGTYSVTITVNGCTSAAGTTNVVVNATPATPTASNTGPYCEGATIQLSTPFVSGASYSWTGPNGFSSSLQNPTRTNATTADAGTYSVTITVNGCTSAAGTTNVVVNATPATPTASNTGPYCEGATIQLSTPTVSGATYSWTGPNGFTSSLQNPTRSNATTADAGTYSVTITVNGCTSAAGTTNVVVNATAQPTISPGGSVVFCFRDPATLTSSSATGNQWYAEGTLIPGATGQNLVVNQTLMNTYSVNGNVHFTVTVTQGSCSSTSAPKLVTMLVPGTPVIEANGPTSFCTGGSVELDVTLGPLPGQWYRDNVAIGGATSSSYVATASGSYTFVNLFYTSCPSDPSNAIVVTVSPVPSTPTITPSGPTTFCSGGSVTLTSSSASGNQWYVGGNPIAGETNQTYLATASGNYTVVVTQSGCASAPSTATTVTVNPTPPTPTASNGGPYCEGATIQLSTPFVSGATYSWTGPNGFTSSQQNPTRTNATPADAGTYSVTITVNGCTSAAGTTNVVVNATPATPTASNGGPYCAGSTIQLNTPTVSGATYAWTGPNGFTSSLQNPTRSNATTADAGTYSVTITVNGCTSAAGTTNVVVNATPATPTASNTGPYCAGATIQLNTPTVSGATYAWTGPNGFTSSLQNPTRANATTADAGTYSVTITVNGCTSAAGTTNVVVNATPGTPTITPSGPTTFCSGGSVTLTSSSASGNQWYLNGSPIGGQTAQQYVASAAGNYTVVVTSGSCSSAPSATTTVTVNPNPNATITAPSSVVAGSTGNGASVANAGAGATYNWSITNGTITAGTGTSGITFTAGAAGTLTLQVTVTTSAGCADTKSANVNVTPSASVTITSVTPSSGKTSGGKNVTINGTGFQNGAAVTFGGAAATNIVVVNSTKITAKTPAHAAGSVNVTVTNPDTSSATRTNGYTFVSMQFDPNGDQVADPADIFYLVNYLFLSGPPPAGAAGMDSGDANGDDVVDPADIFYIVSYLFLGGPAPAAAPPRVTEQSLAPAISGSLRLGNPVRRDGRVFVPVTLDAAPASELPQALSLHVKFSGDDIRSAAIRRVGPEPAFEISRRTSDGLAYLVVGNAPMRNGVIAEIEIDVRADAEVSIEIDPALTMIGNANGTKRATPGAGTLQLSGTAIGPRRNRERR